jgi:hypothetical protein
VILLFLLAVQAMGPEVTTYYPLPPREQQQEELRKAQGLPVAAPAPAAAPTAKSQEAKPAPKPEAAIKVVSVKAVPADANAVFQPEPRQPPK